VLHEFLMLCGERLSWRPGKMFLLRILNKRDVRMRTNVSINNVIY
jgi:hypothetical protein